MSLLVSVLVEMYFLRYGQDGGGAGYKVLGQETGGVSNSSAGAETHAMETGVPLRAKMIDFKSGYNYESTATSSSSSSQSSKSDDLVGTDPNLGSDSADFFGVSGGRPPVDAIVGDVLKAERPGVYFCGPKALFEAVEGAIKNKRSDCAFYQEDPDM